MQITSIQYRVSSDYRPATSDQIFLAKCRILTVLDKFQEVKLSKTDSTD